MTSTELELESQSHLAVERGGDGGQTEAVSIFRSPQSPVILKFEEVVYKIKTKIKSISPGTDGSAASKPKSSRGERLILKGISGAILPGEMLAMMGPSGSGKTTLLTALGARLHGNLTGSITYNGQPFSTSMKRNMGFVTQDDVLYPHLTVTETLVYTALLRLPRTLTRMEKAEQAEAVIAQLGLSTCRNSIIGGPLVRGVSGGERKRVSIGQEMLTNPSLIFLDEPTSGLDSTTAQRIVSTLRELTQRGRTVVMTIHQPSSRLFYMFHKLLLMSDGHPIYFGKASDAMEYFSNIGYTPSVPMNPADFLLDLANGVPSDESDDNRAAVKQAIVSAYTHNLEEEVEKELRRIRRQFRDTEPEKDTGCRWSTSWWEQFAILFERSLKSRKYESFSPIKISQILVTALLGGLLWWQSGGHVQDQIGLLFFITGFWGFTPVFESIFTFPQERTILAKERSSGMYRLSSYFMARTVSDLPMELVLPVIFTTSVYWMGGLKANAGNFFETLASILIGVMASQGFGLMLGALVVHLKTATTLAGVVMLVFMLAGGFFVQKVPPFISWIKYVSLIYHTFKLTLGSQFTANETYLCGPKITCLVRDIPAVKVAGLDRNYISVLALFIMFFAYRIVAYLALTRVGATP